MVLVEKPELSLTSSENHNNDKNNKLINKKKLKARHKKNDTNSERNRLG
jgi:hypothetical protein